MSASNLPPTATSRMVQEGPKSGPKSGKAGPQNRPDQAGAGPDLARSGRQRACGSLPLDSDRRRANFVGPTRDKVVIDDKPVQGQDRQRHPSWKATAGDAEHGRRGNADEEINLDEELKKDEARRQEQMKQAKQRRSAGGPRVRRVRAVGIGPGSWPGQRTAAAEGQRPRQQQRLRPDPRRRIAGRRWN